MSVTVPAMKPSETPSIESKRLALEEALAREEARRQEAIDARERFFGLQVEPEVSYYDDAPQREPGDRNWVGYGFDIHPQVSLATAFFLILFVGFTLGYQAQAAEVFSKTLAGISKYFGWFYIFSANGIVLAMLVFAFGRFGSLRLGGPEARPEFSDFGWYAMLLSAGMGIGLMYWSIAEPLMHLGSPPPLFPVPAGTPEAAQVAFAFTYYHWGIHPWGIYALVGLALAFFAFNRGLPLTIRSVFYPLLGEKIYGFWGNAIDTLSVLATLCGLATSLGLGVQQVAAGLDFLGPLPRSVRSMPIQDPGSVLEKTKTLELPGDPPQTLSLELGPQAEAALPASEFRRAPGGPSRALFASMQGELWAPTAGRLEDWSPQAQQDGIAGSRLGRIGKTPISMPRDGRILEVLVRPGDTVEKGQLLLRIEELGPTQEALVRRWRALYRAWKRAIPKPENPEDDPVVPARAKALREQMKTLEVGLRSKPSTGFLVFLIVLITGFATASVVAGLDAGVQRLSEVNMVLAAGMLVFLLFAGPTLFLIRSFVQNLGFYLQNLPQISLWTEAYRESSWQSGWTVFYWGWWISWSPFVGMFIARISKGRTVREFILGVMCIPSMLSFFWMSVFGGTAMHLQKTGQSDVVGAVQTDVATALFEMLRALPGTGATSILGILLVTFFFVTSSDSGSLVVDHLTSGGKLDSPVPQRIFWASTEGLLAAVLLLGGGLTALQTASIATGLPFAVILLVMIFSLQKDLSEELFQLEDAARRRDIQVEMARNQALAEVAVHEHVAEVEKRQEAARDLEEALQRENQPDSSSS